MKLENRIKALVKEHGTLSAAADAVGVNKGYLSRMLDGSKSNPSDAVLERMGLVRVVDFKLVDAA